MRSLRLALVIAAAFGLACVDGDEIINGLCDSGDDCWRDQTCVKTPAQQSGLGWCRPDSGCAIGEQPGCRCKTESGGVTGTCDGLAVVMDGDSCGCCEPCGSGMMAVLHPDGRTTRGTASAFPR